jgi:hypothetical protein
MSDAEPLARTLEPVRAALHVVMTDAVHTDLAEEGQHIYARLEEAEFDDDPAKLEVEWTAVRPYVRNLLRSFLQSTAYRADHDPHVALHTLCAQLSSPADATFHEQS